MTNEEALKVLDSMYIDIVGLGETEEKPQVSDMVNAIDIAKYCIKERIAMKPTWYGDGYYDGELVMDSYECPKCRCLYDYDFDGEHKFCPECGQALDWSEEE